ncbi:MAG: hypothetical protein K8W52_28940 [Deltaproteobacteria bacterium]|nr:hypothetical protein [Deltaproteobacteria bacterium]
MKKNTNPKKLELALATLKTLTEPSELAQVAGGRRCTSSASNTVCSGDLNC